MCSNCCITKTSPKKSLDTTKLSVRKSSLKSRELRSLIYKMRRKSGDYKCTKNDYRKGYNSTKFCGRKIIQEHGQNYVFLLKGKKTQKPFYHGVMKCGSVWRCPVCSKKITDYRQKEVYFLASEWLRKEGELSFITLTLRHNKTDSLKMMLNRLNGEFRKMQRTSIFRKIKSTYKITGFVKALEITYSFENGWHPHLHLLVFHNSKDSEQLHKALIKQWTKRKVLKATQKAQNAQSVYNKNGISNYVTKWDLSAELTKSSYVTKWDFSAELTKSSFKVSKSKRSFTGFALLKSIIEGKFEGHQMQFAEWKYQEYIAATYRRHMIHISKEVRKLLTDQDLKSVEEILKDEIPDETICKIDKNLWKEIIAKKIEANLLNAYELGGIESIKKLLIKKQLSYHWVARNKSLIQKSKNHGRNLQDLPTLEWGKNSL